MERLLGGMPDAGEPGMHSIHFSVVHLQSTAIEPRLNFGLKHSTCLIIATLLATVEPMAMDQHPLLVLEPHCQVYLLNFLPVQSNSRQE